MKAEGTWPEGSEEFVRGKMEMFGLEIFG